MDIIKLLHIDLQLFADGGDGGSGGADGGNSGNAVGGGDNAGATVVYGKQPAQSGAEAPQQQGTPDMDAAFDALIKREYKAQYDARVKSAIQNRLKGTQAKVQGFDSMQPIMEMLGRKYGIQPGKDGYDIAALQKAVEDDDSYFEQEAMKNGLTVEQQKNLYRMERENEQLRQMMQQRKDQEVADRRYAQWLEQAAEVKKVYPGFNIEAELKNPEFCRLLQSGITVDGAFKVIHMDDLMRGGMKFAVEETKKQVANSIASGKRPSENGSSGSGAVVYKNDVSKLSYKDMDEINRRVRNGERISF